MSLQKPPWDSDQSFVPSSLSPAQVGGVQGYSVFVSSPVFPILFLGKSLPCIQPSGLLPCPSVLPQVTVQMTPLFLLGGPWIYHVRLSLFPRNHPSPLLCFLTLGLRSTGNATRKGVLFMLKAYLPRLHSKTTEPTDSVCPAFWVERECSPWYSLSSLNTQ